MNRVIANSADPAQMFIDEIIWAGPEQLIYSTASSEMILILWCGNYEYIINIYNYNMLICLPYRCKHSSDGHHGGDTTLMSGHMLGLVIIGVMKFYILLYTWYNLNFIQIF